MRLDRWVPRRRPKREPLIRPEDILLSKRITWRIDEPFTIFECENFFDEHIYQQLAAEFPIDELRARLGADNLRSRIDEYGHSKEFRELLSTAPTWRAVRSAFRAKRFQQDYRRIFRSSILARYPGTPALIGRLMYAIGLPWTSVKFDFVLSRPPYHLSPHTDGKRKVLALVAYLPIAGRSSCEDSMATKYWAPNDDCCRVVNDNSGPRRLTAQSLPRRLRNSDADDSTLDEFLDRARLVASSKFRDRAVVGFVKSSCSWHSVDLRGTEDGMERCSVLINVSVVDPLALLSARLRARPSAVRPLRWMSSWRSGI